MWAVGLIAGCGVREFAFVIEPELVGGARANAWYFGRKVPRRLGFQRDWRTARFKDDLDVTAVRRPYAKPGRRCGGYELGAYRKRTGGCLGCDRDLGHGRFN